MLSKEKYKDEIVEIVTSGGCCKFGVDKKIKKPIKCTSINCSNCLFNSKRGCDAIARNKWANSEVIEPIELIQTEKTILESIDKQYKWIARDSDNDLCLYGDYPEKGLKFLCGFGVFNHLFKFIKWEDKEPYCIENILNNCVIKED